LLADLCARFSENSPAAPVNAPNSPYRPVLSSAARPATFEVRAVDETGAERATPIAGEHPLTLYVDKQEVLTLMTLGAAPEALAIGYLRNQRLVDAVEDIVSVQVDWEVEAVVVKTRKGLANLRAKTRKLTRTTGCGQGTMFGDLMEDIERVRLPAGATLTRATLYALLDRVRLHETIYKQAGAVHGCALATNDPAGASEILMFVEDVGRHNAVDAIAGQMWLDRIDGGDKIFYTTGRLTSEMVIKAAQMGIPFLVSRSGLTQMGYEIARKVGLTMLGRATNRHFLLFTGDERFRPVE
jgi:FdhD protein